MSQSPDPAPRPARLEPSRVEPVRIDNEIPHDLGQAMGNFLASHPQWSEGRLLQAALAGFLFQHGCQERAVVRLYLDGLFRRGEAIRTTP
ncbi:MAG: DUF2811 domain-containing protein [Synechococcus sp.]